MIKFQKLDRLFFFTGITLFVVVVLFFGPFQELDLRNVTFEIKRINIGLDFLVIFLFFALLYFIFTRIGRPLNGVLGMIHYLLTLIPLAGISNLLIGYPFEIPRRYYRFDIPGLEEKIAFHNTLITIFALTFLAAQVVLVVNICIALVSKRKRVESRE